MKGIYFLLLIFIFLQILSLAESSKISIRGKSKKSDERVEFEVIVKAKCKKYKEDLIKTIQISEHTDGGCLPISPINNSEDVDDMKANFSCVDLDNKKSLFRFHKIVRKPEPTKYTREYTAENESTNEYSESTRKYIVSWISKYPFVEKTKKFSYSKRPTCGIKKELCSSKEFLDHCTKKKVSMEDDFVCEEKERVYLIPPRVKFAVCFLESACCPYISKLTSGICGGKINPCEKKICNDQNNCTIDRCDPQNGKCKHTPIKCNDKDKCTSDSCHREKGCLFSKITCDDNDLCTDDSCDPKEGCVFKQVNCDDKNPDTIDTCDKRKGCVNSYDCSSLKCDDNIPCTDDSCDPIKGCVYTPNNSKCGEEANTCDAKLGCVYRYDCSSLECNDNIPCTDDSCSTETGCVYTPNNSKCGEEANTCDVKLGCVYRYDCSSLECDDNIPCTDDTCDPIKGCVYTPDNSKCGEEANTCDAKLGCVYRYDCSSLECNDNISCTDDTCDLIKGCVFTSDDRKCGESTECVFYTCTPTGCETTYSQSSECGKRF